MHISPEQQISHLTDFPVNDPGLKPGHKHQKEIFHQENQNDQRAEQQQERLGRRGIQQPVDLFQKEILMEIQKSIEEFLKRNEPAALK